MLSNCTVYAPPAPAAPPSDTRQSRRHLCWLEATSQPVDAVETVSWGAVVRDLSAHGVGLVLCYPFKAGTMLTVELKDKDGRPRSYRAMVIHARDRADGSWLLGCEFDTPLAQDELDDLV